MFSPRAFAVRHGHIKAQSIKANTDRSLSHNEIYFTCKYIHQINLFHTAFLLSCQPRVTVTSCFVYKVIMDLESIDHVYINPIRRIGLIHT